MTDRRKFIKQSAIATAAVGVAPGLLMPVRRLPSR